MYKLLALILLLNFPLVGSSKNHTLPESSTEIRVAALVEPPFISYDLEKNLTGPAIDIFKQAAIRNNWRYKLFPVKGDVNKLIKELTENKYDILIGPISITLSRIQLVSFSRPFYLSQEKLAIHRHTASPLKAVFDIIVSIPLGLVIFVILLLLLVSHIIWLAERDKNNEMPSKYIHGILFSSWLFVAHFFKGGLLYRPKTNMARFILIIWLIIALSTFLVATSTYTAYITARLVDTKKSIDSIEELEGVKIAYVKGQEYETFPRSVGAIEVPASNMKKALLLVKDRKVFGAIGGQIIMESELAKLHTSEVVISTMKLSNDEYAFALPLKSPYLRPINLTIVEMRNKGEMMSTCKMYLGDKYLNCEF